MKYLFVLLVLFVTGCAPSMPLPTPMPDNTSTPRPLLFEVPHFVFQGEDPSVPIITHNPSPKIKNLYINPGAILFHDGKFHMFFNSFTAWPGSSKLGMLHLTMVITGKWFRMIRS